MRQHTFTLLFCVLPLTASLAMGQPVLVKDVDPGTAGSAPQQLVNANGTLYFTAYNPAYGSELYKSNGTAAGTVLVRSFSIGLSELTFLNEVVYFTDHGKLLKTNGTGAGTVLVKNLPAWQHPKGYWLDPEPRDFTVSGGKLYFVTTSAYVALQLWKSDGTAAGTIVVSTLNSVGEPMGVNLLDVNGTLYYTHSLDANHATLYKTNRTTVTNLKNFGYPEVKWLTDLNGRLYFAAGMGGTTGGPNVELWTSDGTSGGTVLAADINPYGNQAGSFPAWLTNVDDILFFSANNGGAGQEL